MRVPGVRFVQGRNRYGTSTKYGIAVHATANTASAANEAAYATRRTDGTSAHFYIDSGEVIQSLDTNDRAGHAGSTQGNTYAIALEFTGLTSWSRAKWLSSVAWDRIGAVLAAVSRHHGIPATRATVAQMKTNPRVRGAYDHNQMRLAWGGTDHTDPGPNFPWDRLLTAWQQHLSGEADDMSAEAEAKIHAVHTAVFHGGSSTGRYVDPDGSGKLPADNSVIAKLDYTMMVVDAVLAAVKGTRDAETIVAEIRAQGEQQRQAMQAMRGQLATELAPAVVAAVREEIGDVDDLALTAALERGMRTVLGALDGATPQA